MKAVIILGCEGFRQKDFLFCPTAENVIIDLEKIENSEGYFDLIKYLDGVVKIFENPCNKYNIITNAVYKMYEMGFITDKLHEKISLFYNMHKRCSLILYAKPKI